MRRCQRVFSPGGAIGPSEPGCPAREPTRESVWDAHGRVNLPARVCEPDWRPLAGDIHLNGETAIGRTLDGEFHVAVRPISERNPTHD